MQKSVLVAVDRLVKHKKYDRLLRRTTKLMVRWASNGLGAQPATLWLASCTRCMTAACSRFGCCGCGRLQACNWPAPSLPPPAVVQAHDEANECNVGDTVRVHISRPLSKRKSWVVTQVLHRARVFDADSAAKAAAADAAAHHAGGSSGGGLGAPSFAASAVPPAQ